MSEFSYQEIVVGDAVRSYDHEYRRDSYVEGVVEDIVNRPDGKRYKIRCDRRVVGLMDVAQPDGVFYYVRVNGSPRASRLGIFKMVEKLELN